MNGMTTQMNDYAALIARMEQAQLAAQAQALKEAVNGYEAQKQSIGQQSQQAQTDAYKNARLSAIGNNEALAAQGLAGGLYEAPRSGTSETSRVRQDVALRTNLATIDQARITATAQIDRAIEQLKAQGRVQEAEIMAQSAQSLYAYQEQLRVQQEQLEREAAQRQLNSEQQAARDALEKAKILAGYGDFTGYDALGWDTATMNSAYQAANTKAASSSSGSSSGSKPTAAQYKIAVAAALGGDASKQVVGVVERYSGLPFSTAMAAERALAGAGTSAAQSAATARQSTLSTLAGYLSGVNRDATK